MGRMKHILIALFFVLVPPSIWASTLQGKVVKVADGDTVTIIDDSGKKHRIRLTGIDAPEKDQPYGDASTQSLMVSGKTVTIEYEKHDRYKRIVGKILVETLEEVFCMDLDCVKTIDTGLEQIRNGLAWH
jgi:endonuclease YncB( thermonuclease family)